MAEISAGPFTVNGVTTGTVNLPCDGVTTVPVSVQVRVEFFYWDGSFEDVPIWIGQESILPFLSKTLIRSTVRVTNPGGTSPGAPVIETTDASFTLSCSNTCRLTPGGGPAGTILLPDGNRLVVSFAYKDRFSAFWMRWWYKPNRVTVQCMRAAKTTTRSDGD